MNPMNLPCQEVTPFILAPTDRVAGMNTFIF